MDRIFGLERFEYYQQDDQQQEQYRYFVELVVEYMVVFWFVVGEVFEYGVVGVVVVDQQDYQGQFGVQLVLVQLVGGEIEYLEVKDQGGEYRGYYDFLVEFVFYDVEVFLVGLVFVYGVVDEQVWQVEQVGELVDYGDDMEGFELYVYQDIFLIMVF